MPKVLFLAEWYPANFQRWLAVGFQRAGCEVRLAGSLVTKHYGFEWPKEDLPILFFTLPKNDPLNLKTIVDKSTALGFSPDILIFHDWWNCPIEGTENRIPLVLIEHEGWSQDFHRIHKIKPTLAYTGQPYGVFDEPRAHMYRGFQWLPGAADSVIHPSLNTPRDLDFVFFGALSYDNRLKLCQAVEKAGFKVKFGQVPTKEYAQVHNRGLCTMECSGGQQYVKWRIFEAMSMKCLVISDSFMLLDSLFQAGIHYLPCNWEKQADGRRALNKIDLIRNIWRMKEDSEWRKSIIENAFKLIREKHTYMHRAQRILKDLKFLKEGE